MPMQCGNISLEAVTAEKLLKSTNPDTVTVSQGFTVAWYTTMRKHTSRRNRFVDTKINVSAWQVH